MRISINCVPTMALLLVISKPLIVFSQNYENFLEVYDLVRERSLDDRSFARSLVRLSFHDSMGGVDALVNEANPEHNGLMGTYHDLENIYEENVSLNSIFGKADFFAWSYIAAFYFTCADHLPWIPLNIGRTTYTSGRKEDIPPNSPFGSGGHDDVLTYFDDAFNFNPAEVAIILGAHTLGGANRRNTGFVGDWTRSINTFDSDYYRALVNPPGQGRGWEQVAINNQGGVTKYQWRWGCNDNGQNCRDLMLNVDMELFFELDRFFVNDAGQVRLPTNGELPNTAPDFCSNTNRIFADCFPQRIGSETHSIVSLLDDNNRGTDEAFLDMFAIVFGKLVSRVTDGVILTDVQVQAPANWPPAGLQTGGQQGGGGGGGSGGRGRGGGGGGGGGRRPPP